jgi:flagellar biosynthesis/type III secretory pathway chaperone
MEMLGKDANMSEFIELSEREAPEYTEELKERKVKICNIIPEITLLNNQNVELLKHGIIISNKMLETIINVFAPQGSYYNGAGKTDTHEMNMWTINEEI